MATKVKLIADGVITPDQITLTTASTGTNTTAPATTAFVQQEISALVDSSPDALNTLNELAAALGDDANFSTTVTNSIATKLPLAGGTLTGTLNINNSSGFGNIELGGSSGGYVDFKTPFSDDYDARIIYPGGYLQISTSNNEPILLKHNESEKLRTTSTGIDITGNATFDDDGKAIFGAGSDLQIYHNGSNSFIDEAGTGILYIRAATDLRLTNADSSKLYANFEDGGASKLYHDNALNIFTTTSGAEIREALTIGSSSNDLGTTAGDQLTPLTLRSDTSNGDFLLFTTERLADGTTWTTAAHRIQRKVDATKMGYIQFGSNATDLITFGESETERMRIDGSGNLGLGTTTPDTIMEIRSADPVLTIRDTETGVANANATLRLAESGASDSLGSHFDVGLGNYQILTFGFSADGAAATEQMRLEGQTGNFGIGTTSASGRLHVNKDGTGQTLALFSSDLGVNNRNFGILSPATDSASEPFEFSTGNSFQFTIDGSSALRIRSDGGIAIGENNTGYAGQILSVKSGTGDLVMYGESSDASCGISLRDNSSSLNITWAAEGNDHVLKKDATVYMRVYASDDNLALGHIALESNTSGVSNTGIGTYALRENTSGGYNTAIGAVTLRDNLTGSNLTAVGYGALVTNTGSNNTGVGYKALHVTTTGENNTAVGSSALLSNTTGQQNVAVGRNALDANVGGHSNTALGESSLTSNTGGIRNVAIGQNAMAINSTGTENVAIGRNALDANTTASYNTAVGDRALTGNTTGTKNIAMGSGALANNTTASNNVSIGVNALFTNVTGAQNTAVGEESLKDNTATGNSAFGFYAGRANTSGVENTALGRYALYANTTGSYNTAVGNLAQQNNSVTDCIAIGAEAMRYNSGNRNIAIGNEACINADGSDNVIIGDLAADSSSFTGSDNVMIGSNAGTRLSSGGDNTCIGHNVASYLSSGNYNTGIGRVALFDLTTAERNTAVGAFAGQNITTGVYNTAIGYNSSATTTIGSNNTTIGYDSRTSGANAQGQISIGSSITGTANTRVHIGNSSSHIYANYNSNATWTHSSDERSKKDITPSALGLDFVNDLKPVTYKFKAPSEYPTEWQSYGANKTKPIDEKTHHGMIAQDIKKALDKSGVNDFEGWDVLPDGKQQISESMFVFPLIKAVQELSSQVDELKQEIKNLKGE